MNAPCIQDKQIIMKIISFFYGSDPVQEIEGFYYGHSLTD